MRYLKLYILLVLCTIFVSCERIDNPDNFNAMEIRLFAKMGVHLSATQQTKGAINSNTEGPFEIGLVRWDRLEKVQLSAKVGNTIPNQGTLRSVSDFSSSQFFKNATDEVAYAAWYPCEGIYSNATNTVKFSITGESDIMYSNLATGDMNRGFDVMQFNHALSLFRIYAYKSTDEEWSNIKSISINDLPDECTITLPSPESNECQIAYSTSGSDNGLDLSCDFTVSEPDGIEINSGFENKRELKQWIAAPAFDSQQNVKLLTIYVNTMDGKSYPVSVASNFKPGYAYDIVLRFSDNGTVNAEVKVEDWIEISDGVHSNVWDSNHFFDLSTTGTANCYIVSSGNFSYCFKATVKGNGSTEALDVYSRSAGISCALNPKTVKIIWIDEAVRDNFQLETDKIVDGKVLFDVYVFQDSNGNPVTIEDKNLYNNEGNVLLGVYDENDVCLWTWHIWITDKPQKQNYTKGFIALDRNLGAIAPAPEDGSVEGMNGLFYQWGRPTPFNKNLFSSSTENEYPVVIGGRVSPDVAVSTPLNFYSASTEHYITGQTIPYYDWASDVNYVNGLWGFKGVEHEQPQKTIYDPCPVGYHVPYSRNWDNVKNYWVDSTVNWSSLRNLHLNIVGLDIYYPFQGYITKDGNFDPGHFHVGTDHTSYEQIPIVEAWSALVNQHGTERLDDDYPFRFLFSPEHKSLLTDSYSNRSRGLAVRCISDNTAAVVKDLSASQTANCYMVHSDGYYKFKASVRGNGVGTLLPLGGTNNADISYGIGTNIKSQLNYVDILWWQGDFTKPADFSTAGTTQSEAPSNMCISLLDGGKPCDEGYVSFKVSNFSKGNVILAAYDNSGVILWTWHIWLTDKPEDKTSGNYSMMDRFLGATFAPKIEGTGQIRWVSGEQMATLGFYYQWGRKDPIIGPPAINAGHDNGITDSSTEASSSGWWKKGAGGWEYLTAIPTSNALSIAEVVKYPTVFYKSSTPSGSKTSQWFPEGQVDDYTNVCLWGYAVHDHSIQGQNFSKTMHDPCPPGYRTPFHHVWYFNNDIKYSWDEWNGGMGVYWNSETTYDSYGIVTCKDYFDKTWYPFAGMRNSLTGGYTLVGTEGHMNTGVPMGFNETRTLWYTNSQSGQDAGGKGTAYGMSVRCMKE